MNRSTSFISRIFILLIATSLGLSSCGDKEEPIGIWPPMKWVNVNHLAQDDGVYLVAENGGTFSFECTNYKRPWLNLLVTIDGTDYSISEAEVMSDEDWRHFKGEWVEIKLEGNILFIIVDPLPFSTEPRTVNFYVTVGDTGTSFTFRQQKMS